MMSQNRHVTPQRLRRAMCIAARLRQMRLRRSAVLLLLLCAAAVSASAQQRNPMAAEMLPAGTTATYTASSSVLASTQQLRATSLAPDTRHGQRLTLSFDVNSAAVCFKHERRNCAAISCPLLNASLFVTFELQQLGN